jgi:hypothetical protein
MKIRRALWVGILLWILIFVEWSILIFLPVIKDSLTSQWAIHYVMIVVWALLGAHLYYKSKDKTSGFAVGAIFLLVGVILDMIITMPLFIIPQGRTYLDFFLDWQMWIGYIELIAVVGFYKIFKKI